MASAVFDSVNAYTYGRWLANRYKDYPNIIWILGGDRPALTKEKDWRPIWRRMATGIIDATHHQCIITYHPSGGPNSTSQWIHNEPWLDINMFQSGHGGGHGRFRDYDVRKQLYRSVFAGACGVTYGHHAVWQFMSAREEAINYPDRGWLNALQRPGATQAGYLRRLIESRPGGMRIPDSTQPITIRHQVRRNRGFRGMIFSVIRQKTMAKAKRTQKNKLGVENSLVNNINARKKKGISRPKSRSKVSAKSYDKMEKDWK